MFKKFTAYNPDPETVARDWRGRWIASGNALAFQFRNNADRQSLDRQARKPIRLAIAVAVAGMIGAATVAAIYQPERPCVVRPLQWTELTRIGDRLCETPASLATVRK